MDNRYYQRLSNNSKEKKLLLFTPKSKPNEKCFNYCKKITILKTV